MDGTLVLQVFANGLMLALIYMLVALGLTLIYGVLHIVNFAHGEFYMLGAFSLWYFMSSLNLNYFAAFAVSMLVVGLLGVVAERFLFRPFRGDVIPAFSVALGLTLILQTVPQALFGLEDKQVASPFGAINYHILGVNLSADRLVAISASFVLAVLSILLVQKTKIGRSMRAVRQDPTAAVLQGINPDSVARATMFIGCVLAAAAGSLIGPIFTINAYMGASPLIKAFAITVIGGLGSIPGACIGAVIIGFVESFGATIFSPIAANMMVFAAIIVVLLVRPWGLLGHAQ